MPSRTNDKERLTAMPISDDEFEHRARSMLENDPASELNKGAACLDC